MKYVTLKVDYDGVLVVAPYRVGETEIGEIIRRHMNWIRNKIRYMEMVRRKADTIRLKRRSEEDLKATCLRLVSGYTEELGVSVKDVRFRKMRSRWGSCSSGGTVTLSKEAAFLPEKLLEYVVFHEVCHLRRLDHSKHFWQLVSKRFPNHKELRMELFSYQIRIRREMPP